MNRRYLIAKGSVNTNDYCHTLFYNERYEEFDTHLWTLYKTKEEAKITINFLKLKNPNEKYYIKNYDTGEIEQIY